MTPFAYFGTPYVARDTLARLVESGYAPSVVITSPDARQGRGMTVTSCPTKAWATEHDIPVLTPEVLDDAFSTEIQTYGCEYGIVVAYGKILPRALLTAFPKGMLNIHYSLLPYYRGASPVESALLQGETITGVTVQQMAYELDAGDILSQKEVAILPDDTTLTLRPRLIKEGAQLLLQTLPEFLEGTIVPKPQDGVLATRAPQFRKEQGLLSLSADPQQNWNTYRAFRESPGTYFFAHKKDVSEEEAVAKKRIRVKIVDAKLISAAHPEFRITRIIPEGKNEQDFSYLAQHDWSIEL